MNRGDRRLRRAAGKSDTIDAEAAARSVLAGQSTAIPKTADGAVEIMRQLKVARDTAVKARTAAMITLKQIIVTASPGLRENAPGPHCPRSPHALRRASDRAPSTHPPPPPSTPSGHSPPLDRPRRGNRDALIVMLGYPSDIGRTSCAGARVGVRTVAYMSPYNRPRVTLTPGTTLEPYQIGSQLGIAPPRQP